MLDFLRIASKPSKNGVTEIYPKFFIDVTPSTDLMIRGNDFYAIWNEESGLWSTMENIALYLIDKEIDAYVKEHEHEIDGVIKVLHMRDTENGMIDKWHKFVQKQCRDNYHQLDTQIIFSDQKTVKGDFASKKLPYSLRDGSVANYDELIGTLYSPTERRKIEWAIGAVIKGDSKTIQKFLVLYGPGGTGKSTIINIIEKLFEGYYCVFDAKALGSNSNAFALEAFKGNPLVAIQHDGDLSRIEDNTRLNSVVSHENMMVNEKFKGQYSSRFNCFLFMGTNSPVKITDAKSGIIRRLIDVAPTGNLVSKVRYEEIQRMITFELGAIAKHCLDVYEDDPGLYDDYIPTSMISASNDFYNYILEYFEEFKANDGVSLSVAWTSYQKFCDDVKITPVKRRIFQEELKNYFAKFEERAYTKDDVRVRNYYSGFLTDKFDYKVPEQRAKIKKIPKLLSLNCTKSIFDDLYSDYPAQLATNDERERPMLPWDQVSTTLKDIDTSKVHYILVPESDNLIFLDFDLKDEKGNKSLERNLAAAAEWPSTYAELSKGGAGVHLYYIYDGDMSLLSNIVSEGIEIKKCKGKSAIRRRVSLCNDLPISHIDTGLPLREVKPVIKDAEIKTEQGLVKLIIRNLNKECCESTKQSIEFVDKILNECYEKGLKYDVSKFRHALMNFADASTHHSEYCKKIVRNMKFRSEDYSGNEIDDNDEPLVFFDVEVFPNLLVVCWKYDGEDNVHVMINPSSESVKQLCEKRLVGFNCRKYDVHILMAAILGFDNEAIYRVSKAIINGEKDCFFTNAYDICYTDIYDFSSEKKSLKKFEIELKIHHQELGLKWDEPVSEDLWETVADYCKNDVVATEAVFHARKADFLARQILADVAGMNVNSTTNSLTTRIIFGKNREPQSQFNYYNLAEDPRFAGYEFDPFRKKSFYRGEEIGEGGYVYAEPGMYYNVTTFDVASMHPHSVIALNLFGDEYTGRFKELLDVRLAIKHKDFESARKMLGGALAKYLNDEKDAKALSTALKIAINSVYGLTSASFPNPFKDPRNIDNIVAKRGELFMINLKHEVQDRGFRVVHIKTDSIKVENPTPELARFIYDYGKSYGYTFEVETEFEKLCLVNDAVYIAKEKSGVWNSMKWIGQHGWEEEHHSEWEATGAQFKHPYVFKYLFSKEPITFDDLCETKNVKSALYLDMNEGYPDVSKYDKMLDKLRRSFIKEYCGTGVYTVDDFDHGSDYEKFPDYLNERDQLRREIAKGHNYIFVGRTGQFCPIRNGCGGGLLLRENGDDFASVGGAKDYRWLESETVKDLHMEDCIDELYFRRLVDDAIESLAKFGDVDSFLDD